MSVANLLWRFAALMALVATAIAPATAAPTFRISQIYSNLDGSIQYVALTEYAGLDGQHGFAGLTLTVTSARGVVKQYVFPHDLASTRTAHATVVVAAFDYVMPVTDVSYLGYNCCYQAEFATLPSDSCRLAVARSTSPESIR